MSKPSVPGDDDLTSDYDYHSWRSSFRAAYGYYPNDAETLEDYLNGTA